MSCHTRSRDSLKASTWTRAGGVREHGEQASGSLADASSNLAWSTRTAGRRHRWMKLWAWRCRQGRRFQESNGRRLEVWKRSGSGNQLGWNRSFSAKIESSEVVLGPFASASSSRLTLARPAIAASFAGLLRAIFAWAPGLPPTGKTYPTPRNSILPSTFLLCSPRPALCYRPLLTLLLNLAIKKVTPLGPRTPHQPEKLKKLSKNNLVVLLLFFPSMKNRSL